MLGKGGRVGGGAEGECGQGAGGRALTADTSPSAAQHREAGQPQTQS